MSQLLSTILIILHALILIFIFRALRQMSAACKLWESQSKQAKKPHHAKRRHHKKLK